MAFEQQTFFNESKRSVKSDQFESTSRIEVQPEKPVKKVVLVNAMAKITNKEKVGENVNFSGKTTYQITYQSEDNSFCSAVAFVEWSGKLEQVKEENISLKASVIASTITGFSSTEIAVSSLVNVEAEGVVKEEIQTVDKLPEEFVKLEKTFEFQKVVSFVSDSFNEVAEQEISGLVSDVLYSTAKVQVQNVSCGIDTMTVDGMVFAKALYVIDGKITEIQKEFEFKREIGALSVVPNNVADANVWLDNIMVTASTNESDQKTNLVFSVELSLQAVAFVKENEVLVQDCFSTEKETENTYECVTAFSFDESKSKQEDIMISVQTPENATEVHVLKVDAEITDKVQTENGTRLNGAVAVEMLCVDSENNSILDKAFAPFSIEMDDVSSENEFSIAEKLGSVKRNSNLELDLDMSLFITSKGIKKEYVGFVKNVEEKEEKQKSDAGIRVYIIKEGEDIFSVAKAVSVRPETILSQNPEAKEVFEEGTRLVLFNGLDASFNNI